MRFYKHAITENDLFILIGDAPKWLNIYVDGRHSKEERAPMYCRLVPSGEVALVHVAKWVYTDLLTEISGEEAHTRDSALVDRIAEIAGGEEAPQFTKRTKYFSTLRERHTLQPTDFEQHR